MKKINTAPISGMQELLPGMQAEFNRLKNEIARVFGLHGFQNIETPMIERAEILLAKAGGDTEKQIYKVVKTAETANTADQALRFDHTVPLARYVVEHTNDLVFPFKVTQVGRNFRGERAQRGRFREFYQCDVDIVGWNDLPVAYDAEILVTLAEAIRVLPLPSFVMRVSNRKILSGFLQALNLEMKATEILEIVDHAEKVPKEKTLEFLNEVVADAAKVEKLMKLMEIRGEREEAVAKLRALEIKNELFEVGVQELDQVLKIAQELSPETQIVADMLIVRGLDYYTGMVFETIVPEYREIGSVCSGGRYEDLASYYSEQKLPAVGGSIGLTRLFYILQEYNLVKQAELMPVDVCIVPISEAEIMTASKLAEKLRAEDKTTDIVLTNKKLSDKLKYASKVAKYVVVVGETEAQGRAFKLRNLASGEETEIRMED